jgi:hypothetical protein
VRSRRSQISTTIGTSPFFPNSHAGAQFRAIHRHGNGPVPELEQLCDYGAAALTMPVADFRRVVAETGACLEAVDRIRRRFGTSFEATLYRMATTATEAVAAALFCFRNPKMIDDRKRQLGLFPSKPRREESLEKYRRQSFHQSPTYPQRLIFPWNKSLPIDSAAYGAARSGRVVKATEDLEVKARNRGQFLVEAVPAPYQAPNVNADWPNVLVLLKVAQ